MSEADPLGIFLVKSGSKGDRLVFRYPYTQEDKRNICNKKTSKNPYSVIIEGKDDLCCSRKESSRDCSESGLLGFDDKVLSNLFAVKPEICGKKFELKIDNIRFVGHPTQLPYASNREPSTIRMFNVVFALKANATHSIVNCYHDLSHRLSIAILHEEQRCDYLTRQVKYMQCADDEIATLPEGSGKSPFDLILSRSQLAVDLKTAYEDLKNSGTVHLKINKWIEVSFCLPNKVHQLHDKSLIIEPRCIQDSLTALRPYHGLLLLVEPNELLSSLPDDASPALVRLVRVTRPYKNLQQLAADADLILPYVFQLVGHLVYWSKATIIYPLCDSNVYVLSPNAPTHIGSELAEKFSQRFPGMSLLCVLSQFSLPISLSNLTSPINLPYQQAQQTHMVVWMLQHRFLMQLHTYVHYVPVEQSSATADSHQTTDNSHLKEKNICTSELGSSFQSTESLVMSPNQSKSGSEEDISFRETNVSLSSTGSAEPTHTLKSSTTSISRDDYNIYLRLRPYFKGRHHLEEIMYCENIRRSQLLALLDKFRNILITCQREDPAVAAFYKYA